MQVYGTFLGMGLGDWGQNSFAFCHICPYTHMIILLIDDIPFSAFAKWHHYTTECFTDLDRLNLFLVWF